MDEFSWIPSWGSPVDETPRLRKVQFGDGYKQLSPNGINHIELSYDLTFGKRTEAEAQDIGEFLREHGGTDGFLFRYPMLGFGKFVVRCEKWTSTPNGHNDFSIKASFERDYNTYVPQCSTPTDGGEVLEYVPCGFSAVYGVTTFTFQHTIGAAIPIVGDFLNLNGDEYVIAVIVASAPGSPLSDATYTITPVSGIEVSAGTGIVEVYFPTHTITTVESGGTSYFTSSSGDMDSIHTPAPGRDDTTEVAMDGVLPYVRGNYKVITAKDGKLDSEVLEVTI